MEGVEPEGVDFGALGPTTLYCTSQGRSRLPFAADVLNAQTLVAVSVIITFIELY